MGNKRYKRLIVFHITTLWQRFPFPKIWALNSISEKAGLPVLTVLVHEHSDANTTHIEAVQKVLYLCVDPHMCRAILLQFHDSLQVNQSSCDTLIISSKLVIHKMRRFKRNSSHLNKVDQNLCPELVPLLLSIPISVFTSTVFWPNQDFSDWNLRQRDNSNEECFSPDMSLTLLLSQQTTVRSGSLTPL